MTCDWSEQARRRVRGQQGHRGSQTLDRGRPWRLWEEFRILFQVIQEATGRVRADEYILVRTSVLL